jgi:hypothetical protein
MLNYYNIYYNKSIEKIKNYALKKIIKSEHLRETTSIIPLTLAMICTRGIFNFLITSRLKTGIYLLDFIFSLFVTVAFALSSPFIYNFYSHILENETKIFSTHVIDSFWNEGWDYFEYWKIRILGSLGVFLIFLFFFIEINSLIIQEFIFHSMISSLIIEYINYKMNEEKTPNTKFIDKNIVIVDSYSPDKTRNKIEIIDDYDGKKLG